MAIKIEKEPESVTKAFRHYGIERCTFCNEKTTYWHTPTNNPVCQDCSKCRSVKELKKICG